MQGSSLLELVLALSIMATLMVSVVVVVRSGYAAWTAHEADRERAECAFTALRYIGRQIRQAEAVTAISSASNAAGSLTLLAPSGDISTFGLNGTDVNRTENGETNLVAPNVASLWFVGYRGDGVTPTTVPSDVQLVEFRVQVNLPLGGGTPRTTTGRSWVRSW